MIVSSKDKFFFRTRTMLLPKNSTLQKDDNADIEIKWRSPVSASLQDVCAELLMLDINHHFNKIRGVLLGFTLQIRGIPDCPKEDLPLAVYLLFDDVLGVPSCIELCVKFNEEGSDTNVVGVFFGNREVRNRILKKSHRFSGTEINVSQNWNLQWILDNY